VDQSNFTSQVTVLASTIIFVWYRLYWPLCYLTWFFWIKKTRNLESITTYLLTTNTTSDQSPLPKVWFRNATSKSLVYLNEVGTMFFWRRKLEQCCWIQLCEEVFFLFIAFWIIVFKCDMLYSMMYFGWLILIKYFGWLDMVMKYVYKLIEVLFL